MFTDFVSNALSCVSFQTVTVCFPTQCTVTAAYVTRQPASALVNQESVVGHVTDATRTPTTPAEDVSVSVERALILMHVNEIHLPHNRHHKVSSLTKFHQNTHNYIKYEVYENVFNKAQ